jgi:hypothetical protein
MLGAPPALHRSVVRPAVTTARIMSVVPVTVAT